MPTGCWVCGRDVPGGIEVHVDGKTFGFCTNRHYIDWWRLHQTDPTIDSSAFTTPEAFWMEPPDHDE